MAKVIDTFLFFQELDLAEIRMLYLDDLVDYFVIVEAAQTFSGKQKPFNFENNRARFSRFNKKIIYIKIEDMHHSYDSVVKLLNDRGDPVSLKICQFLEGHDHYDKSQLAWVLDSYHRECIHIALDEIAQPEDIVMLSDLDEIPHRESIKALLRTSTDYLLDFQQHEFRYFLNFYKDSNWLGTISGTAKDFSVLSFNVLRIDSKSKRSFYKKSPVIPGGYHFTSVGNIETIRNKIESWAHQEYNTGFTMQELEKNIRSGQDIFNRETGTSLERLDLEKSEIYDETMRAILLGYPQMISAKQIEKVDYSMMRDLRRRLRRTVARLVYEAKRRLG